MATFEEMANNEDMAKFISEHTSEDGTLDPDAAEKLLSGDYGETEVKPEAAETTEGGETPASTGDDTASAAGADKGAEGPPADDGSKKDEPKPEDKEPVVKAKDGVHEIPYSVVDDLRKDNQSLKEQLETTNAKLEEVIGKGNAEDLAAAQKQDEEAGDTKASEEVIADLEEEFPEAAKMIKGLAQTVEALQADKQQAEQARQEAEEVSKAQKEFETQLAELAPNYKEVEADPKFWEWSESQPSYVKAGLNSGNPELVADVIKAYEAVPATGSEKPETPKDDTRAKADAAKQAAEDAAKKADKKPDVNSLTDIPGGSNPAHDEAEAIAKMDGQELLAKMEGWSSDKIEQHLNRAL